MVAVKNGAAEDGTFPITLAAGDDASGLANMISQYLGQLLTDLPEKRTQAAALRGRLGLRAREGDVAVTLVFEENGIVIEEELKHPDASISGEMCGANSQTFAASASSRWLTLWAWRRERCRIF